MADSLDRVGPDLPRIRPFAVSVRSEDITLDLRGEVRGGGFVLTLPDVLEVSLPTVTVERDVRGPYASVLVTASSGSSVTLSEAPLASPRLLISISTAPGLTLGFDPDGNFIYAEADRASLGRASSRC